MTLLGTITPTGTETSDTASVELGIGLAAAVAGEVTAIQFERRAAREHTSARWRARPGSVAQVTFQASPPRGGSALCSALRSR